MIKIDYYEATLQIRF